MDYLNSECLSKKYSQLSIKTFSHVFDNSTQSYKYFWFQAILRLSLQKNKILFKEIMNEILIIAWPLVTRFHLRLGPVINGKNPNYIEEAIHIISNDVEDCSVLLPQQVEKLILMHKKELKTYYKNLERNVPYRFLSPYLNKWGFSEKDYNSKTFIERTVIEVNRKEKLPYVIHNSDEGKMIELSELWREFFIEEFSILLGWSQFEMSLYLQRKNPSVPGIVSKVNFGYNTDKQRNLANVRLLWKAIAKEYPEEFISIYSGESLASKAFEIDHFIPWSYLSNDEIWNLVPIEKSVNIRKSNRLPNWDRYFKGLVKMQNLLKFGIQNNESVRNLFRRCQVDNLNDEWARANLYNSNNTEADMERILETNIKPIYNAARLQGYRVWKNDENSR